MIYLVIIVASTCIVLGYRLASLGGKLRVAEAKSKALASAHDALVSALDIEEEYNELQKRVTSATTTSELNRLYKAILPSPKHPK